MERLKEGIRLRENGDLTQANLLLKELVQEYPDNAQVNYQCAWSYDALGLEKEAIPYYERAIRLGLPGRDQQEAYIGLGSSLRAIGAYQKAKEILEESIMKFDDRAAKVFLAITLHNLGEHGEAVRTLLELLLTTSSDERIQSYQKALLFYADKLARL